MPPSPNSHVGAKSILDAATALFARDGYDCVSVAEIAAQARVSKANVFHHYESKEALYFAVMRKAADEGADFAESLLGEPGPSTAKVFKLIEFDIRNMLENRERTWLMMREWANDGRLRTCKEVRNVFRRNFRAIVSIFEQGRASGEFRRGIAPEAAALMIRGACDLYFSARDTLHEFTEAAELQKPLIYAEAIGRLILAGVLSENAVLQPAQAPARRRSGAKTSPRLNASRQSGKSVLSKQLSE